MDTERGYHADVYVFCLHADKDRGTIDPMDLAQWCFYVLPRASIEKHGPSYSLLRLERLGIESVTYRELAPAVTACAARSL